MSVTDVTIPAGSRITPRRIGPPRVYTKTLSWVNDWEEQSDLFPEESVWCAAPSIGTATLKWHYGRIARPGSSSFLEVFRRRETDDFRVYVKIEYAMRPLSAAEDEAGGWTQRFWYGVIEIDEDFLHGEIVEALLENRLATGDQTFTAYGFEGLLENQQVKKAFWEGDSGVEEVARAIVFNAGGRPNRSPNQTDGVYLFSHERAAGPQETDDAKWWSSRDIFEYLLHYHTPRDSAGFEWIPWKIEYNGHEGAIPDWDHPEVDPTGRSVLSLLSSVCPRQRLASFYLGLVAGENVGDPQIVAVRPFTFVGEDVETIQGREPIPANTSQKRILCSHDQSGEVTVKTSIVERYDQVIAQGAPRRSVCSLRSTTSSIEAGWPSAEQTEYEAGASGSAGYALLDLDEQRRRNDDARTRDKLRNVFSRFVIPDDWRGSINFDPVFPDDQDPPGPIAFPQYWPELMIERTMPLLEGVDYSGTKIALGTVDEGEGDPVELAPLVFWVEPVSGRYCNVERMAKDTPTLDDGEGWDWSAQVSVPDNDRAVRLNVSGAKQHVVDVTFTPLPEDEPIGDHDWRDAVFTVSLQDDRRAEGKYPPDDEVAPRDYMQILWIDAGEGFRVDWVTPGTVVAVDDEGALVTSTGGYLHDDRLDLESIARIAWTYYSRDRRVLTLGTDQLTEALELGDFVTAINQADLTQILDGGSHYFAIETPITEIRITTAEGETNAAPPPPRMRLVTDFGQLDALQIVHPEGPKLMDELKLMMERNAQEMAAGVQRDRDAEVEGVMRALRERFGR